LRHRTHVERRRRPEVVTDRARRDDEQVQPRLDERDEIGGARRAAHRDRERRGFEARVFHARAPGV
jgi:hypothetical protein